MVSPAGVEWRCLTQPVHDLSLSVAPFNPIRNRDASSANNKLLLTESFGNFCYFYDFCSFAVSAFAFPIDDLKFIDLAFGRLAREHLP